MSSMLLSEASNCSLDYQNEKEEEINRKSFLREVEDGNIQNLIDRALGISGDLEDKDDEDATDTIGDVEKEKDDDCSFNSTNRTVDSLILARQRLPNLLRHTSPNGEYGLIPTVIVALDSVHSPPERGNGDDIDDYIERLQPLSNAQPCVKDLATTIQREVDSSNYSMFEWTRNNRSPSQGTRRLYDTWMKAQTRECPPQLVRVETDESFRNERGLNDDYDKDRDDDEYDDDECDDDDDDSYISCESNVLLGEDKDWDLDPFDDEIDSIVVNKRRMAKHQIHTINQDYKD
jgi:hypothetical protein